MKLIKNIVTCLVLIFIIGILAKSIKSYLELNSAIARKENANWMNINAFPKTLEPSLKALKENYFQSNYLMARLGLMKKQKTIAHHIDMAFYGYIAANIVDDDRLKESYVNLLYLGLCKGNEIEGIIAGAKCFFDKSVDQLTLAQLTSLVGLSVSSGYLIKNHYKLNERKNQILETLRAQQVISDEELSIASKENVLFVN